MKLPNKVTSFKESILSKIPLILKPLQTKDYPVIVLYEAVQEKVTVQEYIDILDCLYALNQITLRKEIIHYVKRNTI